MADLHFADEVALLPLHDGEVALAAAQQHVAPAPREAQVVGPQLWQVQVKHLLRCTLLRLPHYLLLHATCCAQ